MKTKENAKVAKVAKGKKENEGIKTADAATVKVIAEKGGKAKDRPTTVKDKNFLYKFQIEKDAKSDPKAEKKARNRIRRGLKLLTNRIILGMLPKGDKEDLAKATKEFISFYKKEYILQDFTLKSLTNVTDEDTVRDYTQVLKHVQGSLAKKA